MKTLLKKLYDIDTISFIKLSDKCYRIKTKDNDYILKYIENTNIDIIIEKLSILNIDSFLFHIMNTDGEYVSNYANANFLIFEWLKEEKVVLKDLKLKFFLEQLANLHNKTFYTLKVNENFFKDTYEYIGNKIDDVELKIEKYMETIEKLDYKSPSNWLFLLNYPIYQDAIDKANKSLEKFKEMSYSKNTIRMAFTYKNFNYQHIFLKEQKIIGIECMELSPPIYDIFYSITTVDDISVDMKNYYEKYFNSFILDDYEKEWLYSLLYIPKIDLSNDEVANIVNISTSLNYLRNSNEIVEMIKNINYKKELLIPTIPFYIPGVSGAWADIVTLIVS